MRRAVLALLLAAGALASAATPAHAHATLRSADPAPGSELTVAPDAVVLLLSEAPDPAASEIRVLDTDGRSRARGDARVVGSPPHSLQVELDPLERGVYTVTWRVLSRVDGHVTGGAFAFGVGVSPEGAALPEVGSAESPGASPLGVAGRVLLYAGLGVLLGAAWTSIGVWGAPRAMPPAVVWLALAAAAAGALAIAQAQRAEAGVALGDAFGTSIGRSLLARAGPLVAIAIVAAIVRTPRPRAVGVGAAAIVGMSTHVTYGHAAAAEVPVLHVAVQTVHFAAAAVWLGGLALVAGSLMRAQSHERAHAALRYSTVALWAVVVLFVTGIVRSLAETRDVSLLFSTTFGRLVLAKLGALVVLVALGAYNRYRTVPRAADEPGALRRVARVELVVAAAVLAVTGVLTSVAPARYAGGATSQDGPVFAEGSDAGTTMRARLVATPGTTGPNRFELTLRDYDRDVAADADEVRLTFRLVGEDVEPSSVELEPSGEGRFIGRGAMLAVPGPWQVTALVRRGVDAVVVPMVLFPRVQQQETIIEGDPPLHDFVLADGRRAQAFADPSRPGPSEVHATFFDADGAEMRGLGDFVFVATREGSPPRALASRRLTRGHAVADVRLTPGIWRFDVSTTTADGERLWVAFVRTIEP